MITFELGLALDSSLKLVSSVYNPRQLVTPQEKMRDILRSDLVQSFVGPQNIIHHGSANLVGLAHHCFAGHRRMVLDPDSVWMSIERGLAIHITEHSEELRKQFVTFEGKVFIEIRRDQFIRGGINDWEGCFPEFSEKIAGFIGPKRDLIVGKFSTTSGLHKICSEIILMDAMSKYFDYGVTTMCSIPVVTLEGEPEDWENIRDRVRMFDEFGLSWWTSELLPVLDQLILTSRGKPDLEFWRSWYKEGGGSGGPFVSGHIQKFYPYMCSNYTKSTFGSHYTLADFPVGISKVPFVWDYHGTIFPMEFSGGIVGVQVGEGGELRCGFGWSVRDESVPVLNYPLEKMSLDMVIHHKDGDTGLLKRADVEEFRGSRKLSDMQILWEKKGLKEHSWGFEDMFVKETHSGEPIKAP